MIHRLKRLLDKLETPANDWVLSRFGGTEAPVSSRGPGAAADTAAVDEQAPLSEAMPPSQAMPPSSQGPFDHWFGEPDAQDEQNAGREEDAASAGEERRSVDASPPRSREIVSSNASGEMVAVREPDRNSRVS